MSDKLIFSAILLIFVSIYVNCKDSVRHFNGYSVYRIVPKTELQLKYLQNLEDNVIELDFWKGPTFVNNSVDVMVPPHLKQKLTGLFKIKALENTILIKDVEKNLIEQRKPIAVQLKPNARADIVPNYFDDYQRLATIFSFLDTVQSQYSAIAGVETIGQTYQGRDIRLIRIGVGQASKTKPVIFFNGGIHAREWISPATVQCFLQNLIQGYEANDPDITALITKFDFYIIPVLNADGYEYTHTNERLWRKSRQPYGTCVGADLNRNFAYQYGGAGASDNPCSETFKGSGANSEIEAKYLSDYLLSIKDRVKAYFDTHSYGQYWLYPWGYTSDPTQDLSDQNRLGAIAIAALAQSFGTRYTLGSSAGVLYASSGSSRDFAYGGAGIKYSYTVELRDTGTYGFTLPNTQIRDTCEETTQAFLAILLELSKEVY